MRFLVFNNGGRESSDKKKTKNETQLKDGWFRKTGCSKIVKWGRKMNHVSCWVLCRVNVTRFFMWNVASPLNLSPALALSPRAKCAGDMRQDGRGCLDDILLSWLSSTVAADLRVWLFCFVFFPFRARHSGGNHLSPFQARSWRITCGEKQYEHNLEI